MGFELSDDSSDASYEFKENLEREAQPVPEREAQPVHTKPPLAPGSHSKSRPSPSIYRLISQKRNDKPGKEDKKSDDSFDSTEDEELYTRRPLPSTQEEEATTENEGMPRLSSDSEGDVCPHPAPPTMEEESDLDDVSLSAFVPASVRRQSVIPTGPQQDPEEREPRPKPTVNPVASVPSSYRSGSSLVGYQQQSSSSSLESTSSEQSSCSSESRQYSDSEDDETEDSAEINDLLDEAMSDEETSRPRAAPVSDNNIKSSSFY
jgi:hypothetical protein